VTAAPSLAGRRQVADVDFVLSAMDKSHVEKARWPWREMLPFTLSFSNSPDHFDVAIPDPSFWAWPEKAIRSQCVPRCPSHVAMHVQGAHRMLLPLRRAASNGRAPFALRWELLDDAPFVWPWASKSPLVHWRGGLARSGGLRKKLAACANESPKCSQALDIRAAGPNSVCSSDPTLTLTLPLALVATLTLSCLGVASQDLWEPPMGMCRFKVRASSVSLCPNARVPDSWALPPSQVAIFAQGEGYTSSKHRTLGCGSLPVFLEYNTHDTYYGRWLEADTHYKRLRYSLSPNATDQVGCAAGIARPKRRRCSSPLLPAFDHLSPLLPLQDDGGSCICGDLEKVAAWALNHDAEAQAIGARARAFATRVLGRPMVEAYLLAVLAETVRVH